MNRAERRAQAKKMVKRGEMSEEELRVTRSKVSQALKAPEGQEIKTKEEPDHDGGDSVQD